MKPHFLLRLAPSKIHGIGVFAVEDIKKGQQLFADEFPKSFPMQVHEIPQDVLERHPYAAIKGQLVYPDVRYQAYMNHSDTPNYDAINDVALKVIKAGKEITEDYKLIPGYAHVFPWLN